MSDKLLYIWLAKDYYLAFPWFRNRSIFIAKVAGITVVEYLYRLHWHIRKQGQAESCYLFDRRKNNTSQTNRHVFTMAAFALECLRAGAPSAWVNIAWLFSVTRSWVLGLAVAKKHRGPSSVTSVVVASVSSLSYSWEHICYIIVVY